MDRYKKVQLIQIEASKKKELLSPIFCSSHTENWASARKLRVIADDTMKDCFATVSKMAICFTSYKQ